MREVMTEKKQLTPVGADAVLLVGFALRHGEQKLWQVDKSSGRYESMCVVDCCSCYGDLFFAKHKSDGFWSES